ncbi:MAG TPA: TIGR03009 domain-containing protein [Pirellulales bacterium]|nr:TIGR03009 domain-containing protein [Pirellulales bacterium]
MMLALRKTIVGLLVGAAFVISQSFAAGQDAPSSAPPATPPRVQTPATGTPRRPAAQPPSAALHQPAASRPAATAAGGKPGVPRTGPVQQAQHQQAQPQKQPPQQPLPGPKLSPAEQAELDQILVSWEQQSDKIKTLSTPFTMFEYDMVFGPKAAPGQPPEPKRVCEGTIHFAAPDKGSYQMTKGGEERWMCDGKAIYEFDTKQRKLKEYRLPEQLQGKAITNGPLPFVFGAKAETMKQRYVMRVLPPPDETKQILIEAWPRWQQDAANFHHVQVILDKKTMLPAALRLYDPNPQMYKVYTFDGTKVNGAWDQIKSFFNRPTTPIGWQHVVEEPPAEALPPSQPPPPTADARAKAAPPRAPAVKK